MTRVKLIFTALLLVSVTGCTVEKSPPTAPDETEWGYKKLPYDQWEFLFIYPWALPALATQALMVDGAGYKTTYQYVDNTEPSKVSVGRWNDRLGGVETYYNKGKALPLMLRFCWDSVIDKKSYETLILFKKGTWEQMTTPFTDNYRDEIYYRSTMIIGLAPEGKVSVWLGDRGNPVVPQSDAKITTVSGDKMQMCKGVTKSDFSYGYDQDIKEFIKGKSYPYGNW
ncbi:T6SS immunity phospholipase A1-binding lipoprotein Tli1-EAEC [Enterobacter cloacae]|uniref:T6SS immunity phospholipase A1-binding lipoprotein Tli1-EAEC n=1 Tax=Enterobacter cloacae TaxID=550 RepID=UPI002AF9F045|nr:T6SS immunity phospholipase A1-binding lipoprotein Tli1-EAEC [Enterobacter cloacae]EMB9645329.1 T6SS immunity phospholipase A1-binding lipoprotein Tli1-EAEC [Enterobacter cloacae]